MRTFDLTPLLQSTVGFDHLSRFADSLTRFDGDRSYPPYNIEKLDENEYRIQMALAGFSEDEMEISVEDDLLTVQGQARDTEESELDEDRFLYKGIAKRAFERRFRLADNIRVLGATFENGLLNIELQREVPEHKKPRTIEISKKSSLKQLGSKKAA